MKNTTVSVSVGNEKLHSDAKVFKAKVSCKKLNLPPSAIGINYLNKKPIYRLRNATYKNPMPKLIKLLIKKD